MDKTDLTNAVPEMALILAAGLGSRLQPQSKTPKPLAKVLGLTLAERVVCTLLDAGIRRFLVTLGHEAETVRAHFSDIARRRGVTIDFIEAEGWERGNGASALAAKGHTSEAPFFLVMIDHLFDPGIARALADDPPAPGEMRLAVDRDKDGIFDLTMSPGSRSTTAAFRRSKRCSAIGTPATPGSCFARPACSRVLSARRQRTGMGFPTGSGNWRAKAGREPSMGLECHGSTWTRPPHCARPNDA